MLGLPLAMALPAALPVPVTEQLQLLQWQVGWDIPISTVPLSKAGALRNF